MSIISVVNDTATKESIYNAQKPVAPTISGYVIDTLDDTALDPSGGQTILINGEGFLPGATVSFGGTPVSSVTLVSAYQLSFTSPAKSAGTYTVYVVNPDGGTAVYIPGIIYSTLPTWTTSSGSLGSYYETTNISELVEASGDAPIVYSLESGSLPTGSTLYANGVISGTSPVEGTSTTYSFTIKATDTENQESTRSFSITINTDVVTWSSPSNNTIYTNSSNVPISNITLDATSAAGYGVVYTANSLPTGVSLNGNIISGTPTVIENSGTLLTATANTTNRSATRTISWIISVSSDTYFKNVSLLIPEIATTFVDDTSTNNYAITISGDTKPSKFSPYTPGYYSNYFDGSSTYWSIGSNTAFAFGTGDFTIEFWFNGPSQLNKMFYDNRGGSASGYPHVTSGASNCNLRWGPTDLTGTRIIGDNTWHHCAVTRQSGTIKLWVDGVLDTSGSDSSNYSSNYNVLIGSNSFSGPSNLPSGFISNLRVVKGTAVYTANFTPSTTPLTAISGTSLLTCQSNRIIDNSTNNFSISISGTNSLKSYNPFTPNNSYSSYGSVYFDGSGDYLSTVGTPINFGTGDFTVEWWVYRLSSYSGDRNEMAMGGVGGTSFMVGMQDGQLQFGITGTSWNIVSNTSIPLNVWRHCAIARVGTSVTMYINGAVVGATTLGTNFTGATAFDIGRRNGDTVNPIQVYCSNLRVVKGTAVYTTTFTPPTEQLTAVANTSLLTLQNSQPINNNVFLDNSTNNVLVTRTGNATQGSFSPYGAGWSNYFDGTGDYFSFTNNTTFAFGTGSFTIEFWINGPLNNDKFILTGRAAIGTMHITTGGSASTAGVLRYVGSSTIVSSNVITDNAWHHCAIVRNGSSNITLYVDGVSVGTGTDTTNYTSTSGTWYIGSNDGSGVGQNLLTAYISNLRIVKGTAVYTSSFTPSTTPLTPIANTSLLTCADNRFMDESPNNLTLTINGDVRVAKFNPFGLQTAMVPQSYSTYFDGTGDYLTVADNTALDMEASDFTIECWWYPTTTPSYALFSKRPTTNDYGGVEVTFAGSLVPKLLVTVTGSSWGINSNGTVNCVLNTWNHVALVRSGTSWKLYVNGVQSISATLAGTVPNNTAAFGIATNAATGSTTLTSSYISNFRVVKGTAVYTTAFTPPTSPLTAITNTSLLTCQNSTFIDNSTNSFTITAAGNSKPLQVNPFGYTAGQNTTYSPELFGGSMYFDGSGDYLSGTLTPTGTNPITVEAWVYITDRSASRCIFTSRSGNTTDGFQIFVDSGGEVRVGYAGINFIGSAINSVTVGQWYHIAVTRNSSNLMTLWINGISSGTSTRTDNFSSTVFRVGMTAENGSPMLGYVSNLRVVNGTTLYTTNFTPTITPLTAIRNTVLLLDGTAAAIYDASTINNLETLGDSKLNHTVSKFGGNSMYFDGSGDYLFASTSPNYNISTGNFTIELWFRPSTVDTYRGVVGVGVPGGTNTGIGIQQRNDASLNIVYSGSSGTSFQQTSGLTLVANTWYHLALVRNGNTITLYVDGTSRASLTSPTNLGTGSWSLYVGYGFGISGGQLALETPFAGYIDNPRLTKGIARYTSNFTAPTQEFFTL